MFALVSPEEIWLPTGAVVRLPATWQDYQKLCQQRGNGSIPRIKYRAEEVLLMSPLPKHGRDASLIADIIKVLLDYTGREYDSFTPVTMELPEEHGIEPDYCFYIDHWQAVSGKERIDWSIYPPPNLVLEIDVKSYSDVNDYLPYRVPEVWLFGTDDKGVGATDPNVLKKLFIYQLQNMDYLIQNKSQYFPDINLQNVVSQCLRVAYERNTSVAIRELKQRLENRDNLSI